MEILFSTSLLPVINGNEQLHYHSYQTALRISQFTFSYVCSQLVFIAIAYGEPHW